MFVKNAWHTKKESDLVIVAPISGGLYCFRMDPFRQIQHADLNEVEPDAEHGGIGAAVDKGILKLYGLVRLSETLDESIRVRMTTEEKKALETYAFTNNTTISQVVRGFVLMHL